MRVERRAPLITMLACLLVLMGLLVLALPDAREGPELVRLNAAHGLRLADFIGACMVTAGIFLVWATVLAWQRKRIQ